MKKEKDYGIGLYEKSMPSELSISDKLKEANKAGFDFLELSIDESEEKLSRLKWSREERENIIHAMWESGTPILTMCLSGHRKYPLGSQEPQVQSRSLEIMEDAIILARDLGIRIIQIAGYDEYYKPSNEETRKKFKTNLAAMVKLAAREGVILAFETMETDFMNTVEKAMDYVKLIDSPYLQVYPDIGNITNSAVKNGHSLLLDITGGKGHIAAMHLKETIPGKFREIPFGTGHVEFEKAIYTAKALGVFLFVCEFWDIGDGNWKKHLGESFNFITLAMENARKVEI